MNSDPFSAVRPTSQKPPSVSMEKPSDQGDPFADVRIKESSSFPGIGEIGRHAARIGSRIAETIGGIPGDVQSLIESGIFSGVEALTGKKVPKEVTTRHFPTSAEIKGKAEERLGEFIKPQGPTEKSIDEYTERVASLVGPMKFRKALGVAIGAQMAKEGIKAIGLQEGAQEAGALGTMFILSAINPKGAINYATKQFNIADDIAKGASIQAKNLEKNLDGLITDLTKGVTTTSKNSVLKPARELKDKIRNGEILVEDLTAAKRDINSIMGEPETLSGAKKLLKVLGKEVDTAIKPFEKARPDFAKAYRPANEIYGAVLQGNKASNFLKQKVGTKSVLGATLAEIALGHPEAILPTAALATGALGAAKTIDFFSRLGKSPELRKFYGKMLLSAAKEDAGAVRFYDDKIEEIMGNQTQFSESSKKK